MTTILAYTAAHATDKLLVTIVGRSTKSGPFDHLVARAVLKKVSYGQYEKVRAQFAEAGLEQRFELRCQAVKKTPAGVPKMECLDLLRQMRSLI